MKINFTDLKILSEENLKAYLTILEHNLKGNEVSWKLLAEELGKKRSRVMSILSYLMKNGYIEKNVVDKVAFYNTQHLRVETKLSTSLRDRAIESVKNASNLTGGI